MSNIYRIHVTGEDRPGLTTALAGALARYNVEVLDINQADIHQALLLGMLIRIPEGESADWALDDLRATAGGLGLKVRCTQIDREQYNAWVAVQGKPRYIITLLARHITADRIAQVSQAIWEQGLNIDRMTRLSGRPPLEANNGLRRACVELSLRGEPADEAALHARLMHLSRRIDADIAWQLDDAYRRTRRLACFDMDSTLIQHEVIDELAAEAGVGEQVKAVTEQAMQGELDFDQSLQKRVAQLEGLDEGALQRVAERLQLTEGAETLMGNLHEFGYKTAIISGGFGYFGRYLQQRLGVDYVCANELEIKDGKLTGRVEGPIVNGQRKAELVRELAGKEGIKLAQVVAVGDGANDLPMLNAAGLGIAFHAKPIVQQTAEQQISTLGLDAILYMLGMRDRDLIQETAPPAPSQPTG
jgi:phosphoserine phosphatase